MPAVLAGPSFPLSATLLGLIVATVGLLVSLSCNLNLLASLFDVPVLPYLQANSPLLILSLIAGIVVVALPLWGIISLIRPSGNGISRGRFFIAFIAWLIALAISISCGTVFGMNIHEEVEKANQIKCTRNGITLEDMRQWQRLDESGWKISEMKNVYPYIIYHDDDLQALPVNYPNTRPICRQDGFCQEKRL